MTQPQQVRPTPARLFVIFAQIGLTSFGGGLSAWMLRAFVRERPWLTEEEFLNGLGIAQALPGVNVTNMGIWIGYRLCGTAGAIACVTAVVIPPAILMVLIAIGFTWLERFSLSRPALDGAAAAAIGLSGWMGITAARRVPRRAFPLAVMVLSFLAVALLHVPLLWVVLVGGVISVTVEYFRIRNEPDTR